MDGRNARQISSVGQWLINYDIRNTMPKYGHMEYSQNVDKLEILEQKYRFHER